MAAPAAPFFEDLERGLVCDEAPSLTLTEAHAAVHQAILGDRLRLALDRGLCARVLGEGALVHPGLVWDVSIGQSTLLTQRVIANLFYRGLMVYRVPVIGDTLSTAVEVVGLRKSRSRPVGLAALRVTTRDQAKRPILDYWRCAMLPIRDPDHATGDDDLDSIGTDIEALPIGVAVEGWDLAAFRESAPGPHLAELVAGERREVVGGDVVSGAPELARLSLNLATAHHDLTASSAGRRLVYGGHTIGLACSQLVRAMPGLVTIAAWHSCDHLAPVYEGDTLHTAVEVERLEPLPNDGGLVHFHVMTKATRGGASEPVLDWRPVGVLT
jgi:acyl dehydratase